jgi:molecular chaperone Hsp33
MTEHDVIRRFIFEDIGIRGEWVKLTTSLQNAKQYQRGPQAVQNLFGEALAAAVMLAATLKFKGSLIIQAQGSGAIRTLVAQSSHDFKVRGLIRCDETVAAGPLQILFGSGRLVITIESEGGEPYQGIVPLQGDNLAHALQVYFTQSEQLKTRLLLVADETSAVGLLLQELPAQSGYESAWERIEMLASTLSSQELLQWGCETVLRRLFHNDTIRLFDPSFIEFKCTCSHEKVEGTLRSLGKSELLEILKERPLIEVDCEFCRRQYRYDHAAIENLFLSDPLLPSSQTRH